MIKKSTVSARSLSEDKFKGLTFYEFVELLYLSAQYYNPDPFVNENKKF